MKALILVALLIAPMAFAGVNHAPSGSSSSSTTSSDTSSATTAVTTGTTGTSNETHVSWMQKDAKWTAAPEGLPKGAQMTVVDGDPAKAAPFVFRLKFPANYKVAPHTHPVTEWVTVIQGTFKLGMGSNVDEKKATTYKAGDFFKMPANMSHYAIPSANAIIQIQGTGPFDIAYVNASDDPRKAASGTRSTTTIEDDEQSDLDTPEADSVPADQKTDSSTK